MVNNNYNIIKPVEGLPQIGGLISAKRRRQQKKKQTAGEHEDKQDSDEKQQNASVEEDIENQIAEFKQDENSIDYRA